MKRLAIISAGTLFFLSPAVHAANLAVITHPPTIFNLVVFVAAIFGMASAFKVADLVRGGSLFKSWQMFIIGFMLLALAQLAALLHSFEVLSIPSFVVPLLLLVMGGLFAYGVYEARRTLS